MAYQINLRECLVHLHGLFPLSRITPRPVAHSLHVLTVLSDGLPLCLSLWRIGA